MTSPPDWMLPAGISEVRRAQVERQWKAQQAMRKHSMMIGLVCENLLAGRDGLSGIGQFIEERDDG